MIRRYRRFYRAASDVIQGTDYFVFLSTFRYWSTIVTMEISNSIVEAFLEGLQAGSTILELGTGAGTRQLAERYEVISIEHDPQWHTGHSRLLHVPLAELPLKGREKARYDLRFEEHMPWYDVGVLERVLKGLSYDAILIDGPSRDYSRAGMYVYYSRLFDTSVPVIVDDIKRQYAWKVARRIAHIRGQRQILVRDADQNTCFAVIW